MGCQKPAMTTNSKHQAWTFDCQKKTMKINSNPKHELMALGPGKRTEKEIYLFFRAFIVNLRAEGINIYYFVASY